MSIRYPSGGENSIEWLANQMILISRREMNNSCGAL